MRRIALFARAPEPGVVKTRLSPALPPGLATALYRGMLEDAIAALGAALADQRLVYWDSSAAALPSIPPGCEPRIQAKGDLGARLDSAFAELLADRGDRAVIGGADCPFLTGSGLSEALEALARADLAIAPSRDGGYSILGLRRREPRLFAGIPWSGPDVRTATLERARRLGLTVATLAPLDDVDTPEDLCQLIAELIAGEEPRAPRTRAALERLGMLPLPPGR